MICGMPLYEYEHMEEWAQVQRHVADEITLLCDQHHREKTGGLLPKQVVREANNNPYNLREGVSKPYALYWCLKRNIKSWAAESGLAIHDGQSAQQGQMIPLT